jgi:hypothetical protein
MGDVTVPLSRTYTETGKPVAALSFRSPRWQDFVDLGHVEEWQPVEFAADGSPIRSMVVRHHDVVAKYAERCVKEPHSGADLALLDLVDALAVHDAIRDFFTSARTSKKPPTDSSGGTEKGSTRSGV